MTQSVFTCSGNSNRSGVDFQSSSPSSSPSTLVSVCVSGVCVCVCVCVWCVE